MSKTFSYLLTFLTGIIITVMVVCNTELGVKTNIEVSTIMNQVIAIAILSIFLLSCRKNTYILPKQKKARWYWFFGGSFGIVIVFINYFTVLNIGATLAMAGAVFGQSLMGLIIDITGFMYLPKRNTTRVKIISIVICYIGIFIMSAFSASTINWLYLLLAIMAGMITMFQMSYNAHLASFKGPVVSTLVNVISGLVTVTLFSFLFFRGETLEAFKVLPSVPFYLIVSGSILGIFVVVNTNIVIPKIPAVYSALLLSSGQILTSLVFDVLLYNRFSLSLFIGTAVMIIGLIYGTREEITSTSCPVK